MPHGTPGITARELIDLQAHLMLESNLVGQLNHFAQECTNPQLSQICQNISQSRMDCMQRLAHYVNIAPMQ
ncbi:hypothetical protein [Desulforamulus ferrireducens]|uniref:Spore coat protein n=1 Tax=Desulforamulus ferrireducens TaxID=1833852 RepID=A0A1S6IX13_9FIRM|nr:hypothetical protein [Desulforamulus ferrireducens]AQS59314.1 hypothetical protein B0537_09575 [Desulforamulus ferrireducens]